MKLEFSRQVFEKYSKFKKILPLGAEFLHADGRTDIHDEANNSFFAILSTRLKTKAGDICNAEICVFDLFWCNVFEAIVLLIITYNIINTYSCHLHGKSKEKSIITKYLATTFYITFKIPFSF